MLPELNLFIASAVVLAFLVWVLALPFFAAWWLLSVRKSLASIAASARHVAAVSQRFAGELDEVPAEHYDGSRPGIFNSMFGR